MKRKDLKGFYFAGLSTIGFGLAPILARKGLLGISPILGASLSVAAGFLAFSGLMFIAGAHRGLLKEPRTAALFFASAGVSNTLAIALLYKALQLSLAIIVVALTSAFPLITMMLSYFLLGQEERFGLRVILGALLIMGGTMIIYYFR